MNNIYKLTLIFLLFLLLSANIVFFAYDGRLLSGLKLESELESPQAIIMRASQSPSDSASKLPLDLSIIDSDKFQNLKDFKVDLSDFSLPSDLRPEGSEDDNGDDTENPEDNDADIPVNNPEFELGNLNPFNPQF